MKKEVSIGNQGGGVWPIIKDRLRLAGWLLVLFCFHIYAHETAHVQVFEAHGVEYSGPYWLPDPHVKYNASQCNDFCLLANNNIDNIGYQVSSFLFIILALMLWRG